MSAAEVAALPEAVDVWIAHVRAMPDAHRELAVDARRAEREFGMPPALARELVARGLPHAEVDGELRLDAMDLHYVGVRVGCATTYLGVFRRWAAALDAFSARERTRVDIRCTPYVPRGTDVDVLVAEDRWERAEAGEGRVTLTFPGATRGRWPALDPALGELFEEIAGLRFCWVPVSLQADLDWVRRSRLANCASASYLLVEACARRGIEARTAFGLLLAPPYSTPHNWAELRVGEDWVPVDPLLLAALARFGELDATAWPPLRSPGAIFLRLAERELAPVRADGAPVEAAFFTKVRDEADAG